MDLRMASTAHRIVEAGSIRRRKPQPNDIELVIEPRFDGAGLNLFDARCQTLIERGVLEKRASRSGSTAWGEKAKRSVYFVPGSDAVVPVDLFSVLNASYWGTILAIRTGPADFNRHLFTTRDHEGACPLNRRVANGCVWKMNLAHRDLDKAQALPAAEFKKLAKESPNIQVIPTPTEKDFFEALSVPFIPPEFRTVENLRLVIQRGAWDLDMETGRGYFENNVYPAWRGM